MRVNAHAAAPCPERLPGGAETLGTRAVVIAEPERALNGCRLYRPRPGRTAYRMDARGEAARRW